MTEIKIPFNDWSLERLQYDNKTATTRNKKYGKPGDVFYVMNTIKFELDEVIQKTLHDVAYYHFREEGARDPHEFIDVWKELHPKKGFVHNQKVYFHTFRRID